MEQYTQIIFIVILFAVFYFIIIRPQKKRDKQIKAMRDNVQVGDEVVTSGGIVGIVISIKEDTLVIETGGDRTKLRIKKYAITTNETIHES